MTTKEQTVTWVIETPETSILWIREHVGNDHVVHMIKVEFVLSVGGRQVCGSLWPNGIDELVMLIGEQDSDKVIQTEDRWFLDGELIQTNMGLAVMDNLTRGYGL